VSIKRTHSLLKTANPTEESLIYCFLQDLISGTSSLTILKPNGFENKERERQEWNEKVLR
jgi:hypothetical protein